MRHVDHYKACLRRLSEYEFWLARRWPKLSPLMREMALEGRHSLILELNIYQIEEFNND